MDRWRFAGRGASLFTDVRPPFDLWAGDRLSVLAVPSRTITPYYWRMTSHALPFSPPSPWIVRFAPLAPPGARVLDVACGGGRHLRHFLDRGCAVTGVDIDLRGMADLTGAAGVELVQADLEGADGWPAGLTGFDVVIVANYLHRPLLSALVGALRPGGLLLYETFANGNQRHGRPSSPSFLLRQGELLRLAADHGLQVVAFEQGEVASPKAAVIQRLCAIKPAGPAPDLDGDPEPAPLPAA